MAKWDLYDKKFNKTGVVVDETEKIPNGYYHANINVWILNSKKEVLLVRNALNLSLYYPGFWDCINGNIVSGKTAEEAVIDKVSTLIGINIEKNEVKEIGRELRDPYHYLFYTFVINKNIDLYNIKLADGTIIDAKWVNNVELKNMIDNGEIATVLHSRIENHILPFLE